MERLVLKTFLIFLEDKEVVEYCEKISELIDNDFETACADVRRKINTKSAGPQVQNLNVCIRKVIETLHSFTDHIEKLYYHGKYENRPTKDALPSNDYAPLNKFVLDIKNQVKFVRTSCSKFKEACKEANESACTLKDICSKTRGQSAAIGGLGLIGGAAALGFAIAPVGIAIFPFLGLAAASVGVSVGVGASGSILIVKQKEKQYKYMSETMECLREHSSQLYDKLEQYCKDIDFSTENFDGMQGSLSSEDRSHVFITLDSIYNACHDLHQQSMKWNIKVSEIKKCYSG